MRRLVLIVSVLAFAAAGCGSGDDDSASGGDTTTTAVSECVDVEAPDSRDPGSRQAPSAELDASKTYTLTFDTSCGAFTVTLDVESAPKTAASLVALAKDGYFDDTIFHRVVPGFVIQGGDPTQSGAGGPGYSTVDTPPSDAKYTKGVVAMAKTQVEAPGTSGSQFFVVTGEDAGLPPDYALLGMVTKGQEVVDKIGVVEAGPDEAPVNPVVIRQIRVTES